MEEDTQRRRELLLTLQTGIAGKRQKVKDKKGEEEVVMAEHSYQWVDEETIGSSSTAKKEHVKAYKVGWGSPACKADVNLADEEMM